MVCRQTGQTTAKIRLIVQQHRMLRTATIVRVTLRSCDLAYSLAYEHALNRAETVEETSTDADGIIPATLEERSEERITVNQW